MKKYNLENYIRYKEDVKDKISMLPVVINGDYTKLTDTQKEIIQKSLGIQPKIVEKVVVKEKIVYKQSKIARLYTYDDY